MGVLVLVIQFPRFVSCAYGAGSSLILPLIRMGLTFPFRPLELLNLTRSSTLIASTD